MSDSHTCWICHQQILPWKIKIIRLEVESGYRMVKTCGVCNV